MMQYVKMIQYVLVGWMFQTDDKDQDEKFLNFFNHVQHLMFL